MIVVVFYLAVSLAAGLTLGRSGSSAEFLLAGRSFAWPALLLSIVATETSTVTFLSLPGKAYLGGGDLRFLQIALGFIVGRVIVALVLLPEYFRGELFTAHEALLRWYGPQVRRAASVIFLLFRNLADGLRLLLAALTLQFATGMSFEFCVIVMTLATLVYATVGGAASVVWSDCLQFIVYIAGALAALWVLVEKTSGDLPAILEFASSTGRDRLFDFSPGFTGGSVTFWSGLVGGTFLAIASHGVDQLMVQRYLSARSLRHAAVGLVLSGPVILVQFALFLVIGVGLASFYAARTQGAPLPADEVFLDFIVNELPPGLGGLLIAAVMAAAMSTLSSSLNASAAVLLKDILQPLRGEYSPAGAVRVARIGTVLFGLIQGGVALGALRGGVNDSVIDSVLSIAGMTTGLLVGLFALGFARGRSPEIAGLAGLAAGFTACCWLKFGTDVNWCWYALVGAATTAGVAWMVALLVEPRYAVREPS